MTWEYALIGLVVGIIIGAVAMRFGNRKLRQQQALQYELEKNKADWTSIAKSWLATLPAARNYWIPWRTTIASCINTWRKAPAACCRNCLLKQTRSVIVWQSLKPATIRHRCKCLSDYSEGASGLLQYWREARLIYFSGAAIAPFLFSPIPDYHLIWCLIVSRLKIQYIKLF